MLGLAIRGLVSRKLGTSIAALGLLTATLGFISLASTAKTAEAILRGDVATAWQTPFDILVRPAGSTTALESKDGLVRPNYISGLSGGISDAQLRAIRAVPGVEVAAPIAIVGGVLAPGEETINLQSAMQSTPLTVFRATTQITSDNGMSKFPLQDSYLIEAPTALARFNQDPKSLVQTCSLEVAAREFNCDALGGHVFAGHTFFSGYRNGNGPAGPAAQTPDLPPGVAGTFVTLQESMIVAGIDPAPEAQLAGISKCITSGRYLTAADVPHYVSTNRGQMLVPVIVSSHSFSNDSIAISVSRAGDTSRILDQGVTAPQLSKWTTVVNQNITANDFYENFLKSSNNTFPLDNNFYIAGDVRYEVGADGTLTAQTQNPDYSVFANPKYPNNKDPQLLAPEQTDDTWFRALKSSVPVNAYAPGDGPAQAVVVGTYNPDCIPGFNSLAGGRLETYAPPGVRSPDGALLGPSGNLAGYVNSPPLMLTTLAGAALLTNPTRTQGGPGASYISAVRIRVGGTNQPGPVAEARLARVAAQIHQLTGLTVDIVKGSSPRTVRIELPAGKFGRPALTVTEGWSVKGVALVFVEAVAAQNVALFVLVLVAAAVLVGQTALGSVQRRRSEFAALRGLGWPRRSLALLVETEFLLLGGAVGLVALAIGLLEARAFHLVSVGGQFLAALPLGLALGGGAALVPALMSYRATAAAAMRQERPIRKGSLIASVVGVALRDLTTAWPGEAILGASSIALGSTLLGALTLIDTAFRGQLDTTVLGVYLSAQIQPFHFVLAILTLVVGAFAAGEVVTLSYLERVPQFATLRALGWSRKRLVEVVACQASALGILGGGIATVVLLAVGISIGASSNAIAASVAAALGITALTAAIAMIAPLVLAYRLGVAQALRGE